MLPKKQRADKKTIEKIFSMGKFAGSGGLSLKYYIDSESRGVGAKISFTAPKAVAKKAVSRNTLRRRGYSAVEKYVSSLPVGFRGVFIIKDSKTDMEREIKEILKKIK